MSKSSAGLMEKAHDYILSLIMTQQLSAGQRIPEVRIAEQFSISRTPVRDAMRQLANEGLIEIYPNRFAEVKKYTEQEIREIGILRVAFDTTAVRLAALYGSRADFLRLLGIAEKCAEALQSSDQSAHLQYDCDYHLELARIAGNELLMKFQKELYLRVQYIMLTHLDYAADQLRHARQHFEIAEALIDSKEVLANEIIVTHLTEAYGLKNCYPAGFFDSYRVASVS